MPLGRSPRVLTTVAGWIANFFEAHSPPKEGPLRTIDKWGTTLMDTYLGGFALADFSILEDVGNMIKDTFDVFEGLGQIGAGESSTMFSGVREALAQLIAAFDKTGEIAENVLAKIGDSLGSLGADYTKLIRLQLQYKQIQKQIADLENQKKQTLKNYDAEIAKISKLNVSAEEKAELMRQAMAKRDDELDQTSQQEQAAQDQADVIKDQLDWQKEYIKAQLETLDLLRKQNDEKNNANAGGSGGGDATDVAYNDPAIGDLGIGGGGGNPVADAGEEINVFAQKVATAKKGLEEFWNAFTGKDFGAGKTPEELKNWQATDPEGYKKAQDLYSIGQKVNEVWTTTKGTWDSITGTISGITGWVGDLRGKTDGLKTSMDAAGQSPFIKGIQELLDRIVSTVDIGSSLDNMFLGLSAALKQITPAWEALKNQVASMAPVWQGIAALFAIIFGLIVVIGAAIINTLGVAFQWLINALGGLVQGVIWAFQGILTIIQGVWDLIIGILTGNWGQISAGLGEIIGGVIDTVAGLLTAAALLIEGILGGIWNMFLELVESIIVGVAKMFGADDKIIASIRAWFENAQRDWQVGWDNLLRGVTGFRDDVKEAVDKIIGWFQSIIDFKITIDWGSIFSKFPDLNGDGDPGFATGAIVNKPTHAWVGEGGESEAIMPLSTLPGLFNQMYGDQMANVYAHAGGGGGGTVINIHNPVVREDADIDRIAKAVEKALAKKANNSMRMGNSY